jgi:uncharacterized membrane protein YdbT with pleckstrin-like domain
LAKETSIEFGSIIWEGEPWIFPRLVFRSILIVAIFFAVLWVELFLGVAGETFLRIPIILWTGLSLFVVWVISILNLLWIKASNEYVLRKASLEIKTGVVTTKAFVIAPSGFANMEVVRTLTSRILNTGDIIIRTQDEPYGDKKMVMIYDAEGVADKIRNVMSKPLVRLEK